MRRCITLIGAVVLLVLTLSMEAVDKKPAILFCSPAVNQGGWIDLDYLKDLQKAGFEVDYTNDHSAFSWDRIKKFNVIVIYGCPGEKGGVFETFPRRGPYRKEYIKALNKFLDAGGGVFLMAKSINADESLLPMIKPWGARLPFERLMEKDKNLAIIPRMRGNEKLAFTDQVLDTPVSKGIRQLWYPYGSHYNGNNTAPIHVSDKWQIVARASKDSWTKPVDRKATSFSIPENTFERKDGVKSPPFFAIRPYKNGRLALCAQWPQFSIGQGTKWLYDRLVLSKGLKGKPSDFGKLLENTYRWLAEPSLKGNKLGGFKTDPKRFLHPNLRTKVKKQFPEWTISSHPQRRWPNNGKIYRGLIGARSSFSSGKGPVSQYAAAAKAAKLDFVIFMEDFNNLTQEKFKKLKEECKKHSDKELKLLPGYSIDNNTGNHMFFYGPNIILPTGDLLVDNKLNLQYQDPQTKKYKIRALVLDWILKRCGHGNSGSNVGYYHFTDDPRSQKIPNLRVYSVAAIRFYKDGKLVEDVTDDYLTGAQCTIPPTPVGVNIVNSPKELKQEAEKAHGLTFCIAHSLENLMKRCLRWSHQYDGLNVFVSDGPMIKAWPMCYRTHTYAAENFVTERSRMPSYIDVTSDVGLKEIKIYNGKKLFRRFLPNGAKEFKLALQLDGTIQRNMVLIAEDIDGKKAVSFARRCWKDDSQVVYCGDHVNDGCGYLAKGPVFINVIRPPEINGGFTWDGGPTGIQPLANFCEQWPVLSSDKGTEGHRNYNATPVLEFCDESVVRVRNELDQVFDKNINVVNAWHTYGPIDPSKLLRASLVHTKFSQPVISPSLNSWAGYALRGGAQTALFQEIITFKTDLKVKGLRVLRTIWHPKPFPVMIVFGQGKDVAEVMNISPGGGRRFKERVVKTGEWFGLYSTKTSNSILIMNRGEPFKIKISLPPVAKPGASIALFFSGDVAGKEFKKGDTLNYEFFFVMDAVDATVRDTWRFLQLTRYLDAPDGLKILRGKRMKSIGILEIENKDGAAELEITKPDEPVEFTLPVRVSGLNSRWSAGLFQKDGYVYGNYGTGKNRYRAAGIDWNGNAYAALFPDLSDKTHIVLGHPIVCNNKDLFIQVTQGNKGKGESDWHISANNPTDKPVTAEFKQAMKLPGLDFKTQSHTIPAGGYLVLRDFEKPEAK